jgi:hypothetical protein
MPKFSIDDTEVPETPARPELKTWSTPRVIVSNLASTEGGAVNLPEASSGVLLS